MSVTVFVHPAEGSNPVSLQIVAVTIPVGSLNDLLSNPLCISLNTAALIFPAGFPEKWTSSWSSYPYQVAAV